MRHNHQDSDPNDLLIDARTSNGDWTDYEVAEELQELIDSVVNSGDERLPAESEPQDDGGV